MAPHHAHSNMNGASDERPATWAAPAAGVIVPFIARVGSKSPSILSPVTTSINFVFLLICLEFLNGQVTLCKRGWPACFSSHAGTHDAHGGNNRTHECWLGHVNQTAQGEIALCCRVIETRLTTRR